MQKANVEVCIIKSSKKKCPKTCLQSASGNLETSLIQKILETVPSHNIELEIVGYEIRGAMFSPLRIDAFIPLLKVEGSITNYHDINIEDCKVLGKKLNVFARKIKLTNYENVTRIFIGERKPPLFFSLNKNMTISVTPVISKKVNKEGLKKILEGVRKVEEKVWEERGEPTGRELFLSSVDVYSTENGKKEKIVSYDLEGKLCIYEHNSQKEE